MRKLIGGEKDANGIYTPATVSPPTPSVDGIDVDISIDDLLKAGLQNIRGAMRSITRDIGTNSFDRETIQNLKDLMGLLKDLKKDEKDLIDNLSDEQLEGLLKK